MEDMTKQKDVCHAKNTDAVEKATLSPTIGKLVCTLLSCEEQDLEALARVKYDWKDVLTRITWKDTERLRYDELMWAVVDLGITHIMKALEERILDLSSRWKEDAPEGQHGLNAEEHKELYALSLLNPQLDISSRYDYDTKKTSVWFNKSEMLYRRYLSEALEVFEGDTGLEIEHRCK